MTKETEYPTKGEPLITFRGLSKLPQDSERVLLIRRKTQEILDLRRGKKGPVDDLEVQAENPDLVTLTREVTNPIVFMFPNTLLKLLSKFTSYQKVDI